MTERVARAIYTAVLGGAGCEAALGDWPPDVREIYFSAARAAIKATGAPELLAALEGVVSVADRKTDEFDQARAAIAKAEAR